MTEKKKQRTLTTFIGRILDKISYGKIGLIIGLILIICSLFFWLLSPFDNGTTVKDIGFFDSLYFSIITFTSLGYGDISPLGFCKIIASIEVLSGLIFIAVFVGKVASERQNAMLRLVYTSEQQIRLVEFEKEIEDLESKFQIALDDHDHEKLNILSRNTYRFIASIHNYLKFHAKHGDLASSGNSSALKRLYQSLILLQLTTFDAVRTFGIKERTKCKFEQIISRINNIADYMVIFHANSERIIALLIELKNISKSLNQWNDLIRNGQAEYNYRTIITLSLMLRIKEKLPIGPWQRNTHKRIASELGIQNKLAEKCIIKLIKEGQYKVQ